MRILIINGPNLNMLGKRDPEFYGKLTLKDINKMMRKIARGKARLKFFTSNHEGKIITKIQKCLNYDAVIINAGAFTHTSVAIHDALEIFKGKIIEVHLSNINERESFRKTNYIGIVAEKSFIGGKEKSYYDALAYLLN